MRLDVRDAVLLIVSCCALAATGTVALYAMRSYSGPPVREGLVSARLDNTTEDGLLELHTLETVRIGRDARIPVPAGTAFTAPATILAPAFTDAPGPAPGSKLLCELRAWLEAERSQHVNVVRCSVGSPDERG